MWPSFSPLRLFSLLKGALIVVLFFFLPFIHFSLGKLAKWFYKPVQGMRNIKKRQALKNTLFLYRLLSFHRLSALRRSLNETRVVWKKNIKKKKRDPVCDFEELALFFFFHRSFWTLKALMVEHRNVDGTGHKQKQIMKTTVVSFFFFLREEIGVLHAKDLDTWLCWYKKKKKKTR